MPRLLAAFDFDHTIVDDNSDVVVRKMLKKTPSPFTNKSGWTDYMQGIFKLLAAQGTSEIDIKQAISNIKEVPGFFELLNLLESVDGEVIIISDSNEYFIRCWLESKNVDDKIARVFTNPAKFEKGLLHITKYHVQNWCKLSAENLCKGSILENYVKKKAEEGIAFDRILYVGDGRNDYCPILRLNSKDVAFARSGYALQQTLEKLGGVKAEIHYWTTHSDIVDYIKRRVLDAC